MYCQKRGDKFRYFESYRDPKTKLIKTVSVTMDRDTAKARKQAQDRLNARIWALKAQPGQYKPVTLSALCEAYITHQTAHVAPQTVIGDVRALKAIREMIGDNTDINTIDARVITEILDASGETPTRKNYRIKHIKKLFRYAYQFEYIDSDFTGKIKRYKDDEKSRREFKYFEPDELRQVLEEMKIDKYRLLTHFLALTGLRIGEALALTKDDIDINGRTITVNKSLSLVTMEIGTTKTDDSNRVISIQAELLPVVESLPSDVFQNINYHAYNKYLKETTARVIGRSLTPHSLRHTHVSLLAAAGVPLPVISRRLGHHDSDITKDIYLHITAKMRNQDAALLNHINLL